MVDSAFSFAVFAGKLFLFYALINWAASIGRGIVRGIRSTEEDRPRGRIDYEGPGSDGRSNIVNFGMRDGDDPSNHGL